MGGFRQMLGDNFPTCEMMGWTTPPLCATISLYQQESELQLPLITLFTEHGNKRANQRSCPRANAQAQLLATCHLAACASKGTGALEYQQVPSTSTCACLPCGVGSHFFGQF